MVASAAPAERTSPAELAQLDRLDQHRLERAIACVARDVRDPIDDVLPRYDPTEHRVLPVEPRGVTGRDDEELRAVRVRAGVRHREGTADDAVLIELVLELVARPAGAVSARAAALDHEVRDDAVEGEAVVVAVPGEPGEVVDRLGRVFGEELDLDGALARFQDCTAHGSDATSRPV